METLQRTANRGSISTGEYEIDNSCKFEADNTEYLERDPSSAGNRKTFTTSMWVKRTELGQASTLFGAYPTSGAGNTTVLQFGFTSDDKFQLGFQTFYVVQTNRVFRDTSAWYHIVLRIDTTQSTANDRLKLWINGVEETSFYVNDRAGIGLNQDTGINFTEPHRIGVLLSNSWYFSGYMAEINHIDGSAKSPTDFGEFDDDSGIWKPKAYTGSYGTNGFYLDFADGADLGDDESGNGNDWTENNIAAADQATDTPTNNFCIMNMLDRTNANCKNQEGATKVTTDSGSDWCSMVATMGITKGKWYWETKRSGSSASDSNDVVVGIVGDADPYIPYNASAHYYIGKQASSSSIGFGYGLTPNVRNGSGDSVSNTVGDIIMVGLDMDNGKLYFGVNGTWDGLGTGGSTLHSSFDGGFVLPAVSVHQTCQMKINFGGYASYTISSAASDANGYGTFEYAPPSGYYALCTKNLAEYG